MHSEMGGAFAPTRRAVDVSHELCGIGERVQPVGGDRQRRQVTQLVLTIHATFVPHLRPRKAVTETKHNGDMRDISPA